MFNVFRPSSFIKLLFHAPRLAKSKVWKKPDGDVYQQLLEEQGFIVADRWKDHDLTAYPSIKHDLATLEKYLLPVFWENHQKANYHEDRHIRNQRRANSGLLLLIILSAILFIFLVNWNVDVIIGNVHLSDIQFALKILTAILGVRIAYDVFLTTIGIHQQQWVQHRGLAEELRVIYYKYLLHLNQFAGAERLQELRRAVLDIQMKETDR